MTQVTKRRKEQANSVIVPLINFQSSEEEPNLVIIFKQRIKGEWIERSLSFPDDLYRKMPRKTLEDMIDAELDKILRNSK